MVEWLIEAMDDGHGDGGNEWRREQIISGFGEEECV